MMDRIAKYKNFEMLPRMNVLKMLPKICEPIIRPQNRPNSSPLDYSSATSLTYPACAIYGEEHGTQMSAAQNPHTAAPSSTRK